MSESAKFLFRAKFLEDVATKEQISLQSIKSENSSPELKAFLNKMTFGQLNTYIKKYKKDAIQVSTQIPRWNTEQNKSIIVDGKFKSYKSVVNSTKPTNININSATKVAVVPKNNNDYVDSITSELKKLNSGSINFIEVNPSKISVKEFFVLLRKFVVNKKLIASNPFNNSDWITLSARTIKEITDRFNLVRKDDMGGSAYDWIMSVAFSAGKTFVVEVVSDSANPKLGGAFFRYYHNLKDVDLTSIGIFHKDIVKDPKTFTDYLMDNCLYLTLKHLGLSKSKLNELKSFVVNREVPFSKMSEICGRLGISVEIKRLRGFKKMTDKHGKLISDVRTDRFGVKCEEHYKFCMIDTHYFPNIQIELTSFAMKNYDKVKNIKDYNKLQTLNKKSNDRFIDSFEVVKLLIKYKDNLLTPITYTDNILKSQFIDKVEDYDDLSYNKHLYTRNTSLSLREQRLVEDEFLTDELKDTFNLYRKKEVEFSELQDCIESITTNKKDQELIKTYLDKFLNSGTKEFYKVFFDFESYSDKNDNNIHKPYLVRYLTEDGEEGFYRGKNCAREFLDNLPNNSDSIMLIAHNAGYDYKFLFPYLSCKNPIERGKMLMSCSAKYYLNRAKKLERTINIKIKDSYALISKKLSDFGSMFKLETEKEVIPYKLYNHFLSANDSEFNIDKETCYKFVLDEFKLLGTEAQNEKLQQFKNNVIKWECEYGGEINMFDYSNHYCRIDCEVLKNGYTIFREWIKKLGKESEDEVELDIDNIISSASLAHKYLISQGCYENVYEIAGKPRHFIQKCVVGGRTMTNQNKKWKIEGGKIADFDACSLYPSAMFLGDGFLMGRPKILKNTDLKSCLKLDGIFVKCLIKSVGIKRHFPLASSMTESGVRDFTNDLVGKVLFLDKQSILDLQEFQDVDLQILSGYYFDEGRNTKIKNTISYLYETRKLKKAQKNPIQEIYKLIMNSAYGKSILKPIDTQTDIVSESTYNKKTKQYENKWNDYLSKNYNYIKEWYKVGNEYIVKKHKTIDDHFNNAQVGVEVLSKSKNIMNRVMCLGEDLKLKMYTQDTDSIHIDYDEVEILRQHYYKKYNTELIGKEMGQFHIDFELKGTCGNCGKCKEGCGADIWATDCIFLGKKCYIDKLESRDKNNKPIYGHHIRMKGVPSKSIDYTANKKFNGDVMKLYETLYEGKNVNFDLLCGGAVDMFQTGYRNDDDKLIKDCSKIYTMNEFHRTLSFNYEEGIF